MARILQGGRQRLQGYLRRFRQGDEDRKRLTMELRQERERRRRAEGELKQLRSGTGGANAPAASTGPEATRRTHALPEADRSISRIRVFNALVSPWKPGKMLDLGAGPGTFSLAAARLGWGVTAVDARTVRTPDAAAEKNPERAKLIRSVNWLEGDVREFPIRDGEYDLICIFGLMHHLEVEDQTNLLKRCSGTRTLLTVRVAPEVTATEGPYEGAYRHEKGETREERDEIPQAAWGNAVDFWHTEESLIRLMRDCGYDKVMTMRPPHRPNYTFYLCLPVSETAAP